MQKSQPAKPIDVKAKFLQLTSKKDVAQLLGITEASLNYHLYRLSDQFKYSTFEIPKKSGGMRTICAPISPIKTLQRRLSDILYEVYVPKPSSHGFIKKRGILSNALPHAKRNYVLNLDLLDFFPSINFGRVRGLFMKEPFSFPSKVATVLAQICCFNGQLPQGAPTSPIISNMICRRMDRQLQELAKANKCFYTRYADDITFSTSRRSFPPALLTDISGVQAAIGKELEEAIRLNGFSINPNKTRLQSKYYHQEVTGLTTNFRPNVPRKFIRQIRAMLHALDKYGLQAAQQDFAMRWDRKYRNPKKSPPSFELVIKGKIEFLGMIRGKASPIYSRFRKQLHAIAPHLVNLDQEPLNILLSEYLKLDKMRGPQKRGFALQKLLDQLFSLYPFPKVRSFQ
jgi:RNA-directed DNA polymerase